MYIYAYMYIYIYIHMHTHTHKYSFSFFFFFLIFFLPLLQTETCQKRTPPRGWWSSCNQYAYIHKNTYICVYIYTYAHIYISIHMYICVFTLVRRASDKINFLNPSTFVSTDSSWPRVARAGRLRMNMLLAALCHAVFVLCVRAYVCVCAHARVCIYEFTLVCICLIALNRVQMRGGGLGSRPKKWYGERLGDGVEYHLMKPTPRR